MWRGMLEIETSLTIAGHLQAAGSSEAGTIIGKAKSEPSIFTTVNQPAGAGSSAGATGSGASPTTDDDEPKQHARPNPKTHTPATSTARISTSSTSDASISTSWTTTSATGTDGYAASRNASKHDSPAAAAISDVHAAVTTTPSSAKFHRKAAKWPTWALTTRQPNGLGIDQQVNGANR